PGFGAAVRRRCIIGCAAKPTGGYPKSFLNFLWRWFWFGYAEIWPYAGIGSRQIRVDFYGDGRLRSAAGSTILGTHVGAKRCRWRNAGNPVYTPFGCYAYS